LPQHISGLLRSIEYQSYKNYHVIIVDDGSTEDTIRSIIPSIDKRKKGRHFMDNLKLNVYKRSTRNIDYKNVLSFYDYELFQDNNVLIKSDEDVIYIIDQTSMNDSLILANRIREKNQYAPLLILLDVTYKGDTHQDIQRINGLGKVSFTYHYTGESFQLIQQIEELVRPRNHNNLSEIAITIPVYNESGRLKHVEAFLLKLKDLIEKGGYSITVYLIDDGSSDSTVEDLKATIEADLEENDVLYPKQLLNIKQLSLNTRKAGTYLEAFTTVDAEYIISVDADDSFRIEDIVKMIHMMKQGYYDMVIGTKDQSMETRKLSRKILSAGKRRLTRMFLPKGVSDSQTGLKIYRKSTVLMMLPYLNVTYGLAIDLEILYLAKKMSLRVKELPVTIIDREGSHINIIKDTLHFLKSMVHIARKQEYRKMV